MLERSSQSHSSQGEVEPRTSVKDAFSNCARDQDVTTSVVIVNKNERLLSETLDALKPFVGRLSTRS